MWQSTISCLVLLFIVGICAYNYHLIQLSNIRLESYLRLVHQSTVKSLQAAQTSDVITALLLVREAVTELDTVASMAGGYGPLARYTNMNIEDVMNTLQQQERAILRSTDAVETHPLRPYITAKGQ